MPEMLKMPLNILIPAFLLLALVALTLWNTSCHFLLQWTQGAALGVLSSLLLLYRLALLLLPPAPALDPLVAGRPASSPVVAEVTQLWAGMLPLRKLPYDESCHTAADTLSCRLTVYRHWLRIEYPDLNIPVVATHCEQLPSELRFLKHYDKVDLSRADVRLLPESSTDEQKRGRNWPVEVMQGEAVFVIFVRAAREKEDLLLALEGGRVHVEDCRLELLRADSSCDCVLDWRETRGERRGRFRAYKEHITQYSAWTGAQAKNQAPLDLLNLVIHRIFFDVRETTSYHSFILKKIVKKLNKVKFISKYMSDFVVDNVLVGYYPPVLTDCQEPWSGVLGLFLPLSLHYQGPAAARILLGPSGWRSLVSLTLEVRKVQGRVCVNIPAVAIEDQPMDRLWCCFLEEPVVDMKLELHLGGRRVTDSVVDRLLQMLLVRIRESLLKSAVYPNMFDVPVTY